MLLAALSTGQKLGLGLVGLAFVTFALVSAFLIPAFRPDFPTRKGLPAFLTVCAALFVGMMFAVFFFGRESEEGKAEAGATSAESTTAPSTSTSETSTEATTTGATTTTETKPQATAPATAPAAAKQIAVKETEFKIALPTESLKPGSYEFDVDNGGKIDHDLVVKGPGVNDEKTPLLAAGKTAKLKVDLKSGTYELYCSVPGHKQAGMDVKITVS
ncbi:MAG TPA: plastocyanin/azurin family copper-binding protein [Gaiellaceae bacterium]